jgi:thioester reductase-like protein
LYIFVLTHRIDKNLTIHCLVRGKDSNSCFLRLQNILKSSGIWNSNYQDRIIVYCGDLTLPNLGKHEMSEFINLKIFQFFLLFVNEFINSLYLLSRTF